MVRLAQNLMYSYYLKQKILVCCDKKSKILFHEFNSTTQSRLLMTLRKKPFENYVVKEKNASKQHFFPFTKMFSTPQKLQISVCESHLFCCLQMLSIWTMLKSCRLVKG